jgi:hypothetical protein
MKKSQKIIDKINAESKRIAEVTEFLQVFIETGKWDVGILETQIKDKISQFETFDEAYNSLYFYNGVWEIEFKEDNMVSRHGEVVTVEFPKDEIEKWWDEMERDAEETRRTEEKLDREFR